MKGTPNAALRWLLLASTQSKRSRTAEQNSEFRLMRNVAVLLVLLVTGSACVTNREHARFNLERDIHPSDVFYVELSEDDRRELGQLIADNLSVRGMLATVGWRDSAPEEATILITYEDRWNWDITMFLIEMTITLRDPLTREAFAVGSSYHTSMSRLNPVEMVDEIIANLIAADNDPGGLIQVENSGAL